MDTIDSSVVLRMLYAGYTYKCISEELQRLYPAVTRGLSDRSVRRYVTDRNLRAVSKRNKKEVLEKAVREVRSIHTEALTARQQ